VAASIDEWELRMVKERGALYPGILEALAQLRPVVTHMAICTNGPRPYTELVVTHHGLAPLFDAVRWRTEQDRGKTAMVCDLIAQFSARLGVVIGDRRDDLRAAHENGLLALASGYGYGTPEELAEADAVAHSPADLPRLIAVLLDGKT
jgi:phosphoglycolate phosphatase